MAQMAHKAPQVVTEFRALQVLLAPKVQLVAQVYKAPRVQTEYKALPVESALRVLQAVTEFKAARAQTEFKVQLEQVLKACKAKPEQPELLLLSLDQLHLPPAMNRPN
jgi:hypothetical protein